MLETARGHSDAGLAPAVVAGSVFVPRDFGMEAAAAFGCEADACILPEAAGAVLDGAPCSWAFAVGFGSGCVLESLLVAGPLGNPDAAVAPDVPAIVGLAPARLEALVVA